MGFFSQAFLVFHLKESKKRTPKQLGKLMAKSRSQPVNLPGARPLMNPLSFETKMTKIDSLLLTKMAKKMIDTLWDHTYMYLLYIA